MNAALKEALAFFDAEPKKTISGRPGSDWFTAAEFAIEIDRIPSTAKRWLDAAVRRGDMEARQGRLEGNVRTFVTYYALVKKRKKRSVQQ